MASTSRSCFLRIKSKTHILHRGIYALNPHSSKFNDGCVNQIHRSLANTADESRHHHGSNFTNKYWLYGLAGAIVGVSAFNHLQEKTDPLYAADVEKNCGRKHKRKEEDKADTPISRREKRFHDFASSEYNGQILMSPKDFIESLTENEPKLSRRGKFRLTEKDFKEIAKETPNIRNGSNTFFRDRSQRGIITYSEYLFLVTILTKSHNGLNIALKMMDLNGDQIISCEEFKQIVSMINSSASKKTRSKDESFEEEHELPTTLMIHLFGNKFDQHVTFEQFFKFMDDLQSEMLELEFHEYSKSMKEISELDFAKILLRNTTLTEIEFCNYLDRLKSRLEVLQDLEGISLPQFKAFHAFLNNIDDFITVVNMSNMLGQPIDKDLFTRAVKMTTSQQVDSHIIDVVFKLFDEDGDGRLSQEEFIGIMKDRLKRGFGKFPNTSGFAGFKHCVKKEMTK